MIYRCTMPVSGSNDRLVSNSLRAAVYRTSAFLSIRSWLQELSSTSSSPSKSGIIRKKLLSKLGPESGQQEQLRTIPPAATDCQSQSQQQKRVMLRSRLAKLNTYSNAIAAQKKLDKMINGPMESADEEMHRLIRKEKQRQINGIELIASENFPCRAVHEAVSSCLSNKYSEGYPGQRYYGGNEVIDEIETLVQKRALEAYNLNPDEWGVNVQALSGSPANLAVYMATIGPGGKLMGLSLSDGGHLSHGHYTTAKPTTASSMFFQTLPYTTNLSTGLIDYEKAMELAVLFKPQLLIAGISSYPRDLDYEKFRGIADACKALLMADMAHVSGLVAHGLLNNPFHYCDIVTTTTHKTMRGPRGALIFYRRDTRVPHKPAISMHKAISDAVFPGLQGGPHNNNIAGIGVALKFLMSDDFKQYAKQILANSKQLCASLQKLGYTLTTGGSDNHMCIMDLRPLSLDGQRAERVLEMCLIAVNKNTVPGDKSVLYPSGLRLGTQAMTSRGMKTKDFEKVAEHIDKAIQIAVRAMEESGSDRLAFNKIITENNKYVDEIKVVRSQVSAMASTFPMPGLDTI